MGKPLIGGSDPTGMTGRPPHGSDGDEGWKNHSLYRKLTRKVVHYKGAGAERIQGVSVVSVARTQSRKGPDHAGP